MRAVGWPRMPGETCLISLILFLSFTTSILRYGVFPPVGALLAAYASFIRMSSGIACSVKSLTALLFLSASKSSIGRHWNSPACGNKYLLRYRG